MNPIEAAWRGWYVFPVRDRRPLTPHGYKDGTLDLEQIKAWQERWPGCDWGIDLGRSGLLVLDVDVKGGKPGLQSLEALLEELPETVAAQTPSGGLHLYYRRPEGWPARRVIGWRPGLDLLSDGVLFAYELEDGDLAEAPPLFTRASELAQERLSGSAGDRTTPPASPAVLRAAQSFLAEHGPAVEGEGGNGHTVQAITKLCWDYALSPEEAWPLLEEWNEGCEPPWSESELAYKIEHLHEGESPRGLSRKALELRKRDKARTQVAGRLVDFTDATYEEAKLPWVVTPWPTLDEALGGGLPVGTLTVVTAGTGRGKTSFAAQLGAHQAKGSPVVYYMGELSGTKLSSRVVAQKRRMSWRDVMRGQVPKEEYRRILEPLDFRVVERCDEPAEAIEAALDAAAGAGPVMLVIDYAQLLTDLDDQNTRIATTRVVRWLLKTTVARSLVTVVLSQTSRLNAAHLRAEHEMKAEDAVGSAAESSAFEQDADNVLTLRVRNDEGEAEILVAKARLRGPSKVGMKFHGSSGRWEEHELEATVDRDAKALEEILGTLNASGIYPSKEGLRREAGISSKRAFAAALHRLAGKVEIIGRDPVRHVTLKYPGLYLDTSPKQVGGG